MFPASARPPLSLQSHEYKDENGHVEMITTWGNRITRRKPYSIVILPASSYKDWSGTSDLPRTGPVQVISPGLVRYKWSPQDWSGTSDLPRIGPVQVISPSQGHCLYRTTQTRDKFRHTFMSEWVSNQRV